MRENFHYYTFDVFEGIKKKKTVNDNKYFYSFISLISTLFTTILFHNLNMAVLSITILIFYSQYLM